jgi:hypothetical protein
METSAPQFDLFGRPIVGSNGNRQIPLFHEPVTVPLPQPEQIGSRNANDPRHTPPIFKESR